MFLFTAIENFTVADSSYADYFLI